MAPLCTPAVLLRTYAYGETSRILRFYTRDAGLVSVMARGVRARSGKGRTTVQTFATGELTAFVRSHRDLHTMKDFACTRLRSGLAADVVRFAGASLAAELVAAHTDQEDTYSELFHALEGSLDALVSAPPEAAAAAALSGAWRVVASMGFTPELTACVACGALLAAADVGRFDAAAGGILCPPCGENSTGPRVGPRSRAQLHALVTGDLSIPLTHPRRHLTLLSDFLSFHAVQAPLRSLSFLGDLLRQEPDG